MFKYCILKKNKLLYKYNKGDLLMKKIVLLLTLFIASTTVSNAFVDNMYMTTEQYMKNTGYSSDMAKLMAITNRDPYRTAWKDEDYRKPIDVARKVYNYIAPGMYTDYDFYDRNIKVNTVDWRDF